jgi:UDP-N-acetylglucosamine 2-epimerase (non-hydrolysing)
MIAVIPGNDFELTRLDPIIRELVSRNFDYIIIRNKGYSIDAPANSCASEILPITRDKFSRIIETEPGAGATGIMESFEHVFQKHMPDVALVSGDSDYALAAAIVAAKKGARLAHIEAGLRNYNRSDQSEINRVIIDHISHYLFAPDETARENLVREGIDEPRISVFGNETDETEWWVQNPLKRNIPVWIVVTILQSAYQNLYTGLSGTGQTYAMKE